MFTKLFKRVRQPLGCIVSLLVVSGTISTNIAAAFADEPATLTVKSIPNLNIRMYGFIENDVINDSDQVSFYEEPDTAAIPKSNTYQGNNGRTIMSIRNSRLGFDITMPETDDLKTEAILEMDFLGNQAANDTPMTDPGAATAANTNAVTTVTPTVKNGVVTAVTTGTKGVLTSVGSTTQSERDFFNNPTARIRHAYLNFTMGNENLKIGQTWSLFGWQPYYFPSEPIVSPSPGQLYRRFPQVRLTDTRTLDMVGLDKSWTLETAVDAAKPAQMYSEIPDFHAGIRICDNAYKAATGLGSGSSMTGLSLALSGVWIPINSGNLNTGNTVNIGDQTGGGYAVDALIPIIASEDGKDMSNNLSLTAEYSDAAGDGGLELAGATGGISAPSAAALGFGTATTAALDSGIAGVNMAGRLELIRFETARANLTYILPNPKWAVSAGYAQVKTDNVGDFTNSTSYSAATTFANTGAISTYQYYYGSVFFVPLKWLKFAAEYAEYHDTYLDNVAPNAKDDRLQFTTYITF